MDLVAVFCYNQRATSFQFFDGIHILVAAAAAAAAALAVDI
jgi:hypothetical protein